MSLKNHKLKLWDDRILHLQDRCDQAKSNFLKRIYRASIYSAMIMREVVRDDLVIRSESLCYLSLFSLLPLIAGFFMLVGLFSEWAPAQTQMEELIIQVFQPLPEDYREVFLDFIFEFKDQYLERIRQMSLVLGLSSIAVLLWIALKVFFNIENLMNEIWAVSTNRSMLERIRNFVIGLFILPLVTVIAFALPAIIGRWGITAISMLLKSFLPVILLVLILAAVYRFFPNVKMNWRSAIKGALTSGFLFFISEWALGIYFRFGTNTAYGKLAVLPLCAVFIHVFWLIMMLGAEVSYLSYRRKFNSSHLVGENG